MEKSELFCMAILQQRISLVSNLAGSSFLLGCPQRRLLLDCGGKKRWGLQWTLPPLFLK
jgi:hypothetical protein